MMSRLKSSISWGPVVGLWSLLYTIIEAICLFLTEIFFPENEIDIARTFNSKMYNSFGNKNFGDHKFYVNTQDKRHF